MKHIYELFIKDNCKANKDNCFTIGDNIIYDQEYHSLYRFDLIFNTQYSLNNILKEEDLENGRIITFTIFGSQNSGKSTFLRGSKIMHGNAPKSNHDSNEIKIDDNPNHPGLMLSVVNECYNKLLDMLDNKDDIIILKFSAFSKGINSSNDYNNSICIENLIKNKDNSQCNKGKKDNFFDDIYPYTSSSGKQASYIVKKINSFNELTEEIKEVIRLKETLYTANQYYYILYYFSIEIKSKELEIKHQLNLNFYEINCEDFTCLQSLLIDVNTRVMAEAKDQCQYIIDTITKRNNSDQTIINILCLENEAFDNINVLNSLKLMRFLELAFERNDLYDNTNEICDNCCLLKDKLKDAYLTQEDILKEIQIMNEQADAIASIVHSLASYKKNTLSDKQMPNNK